MSISSKFQKIPDLPRWSLLALVSFASTVMLLIQIAKPLDADISAKSPTEQRTTLHIFTAHPDQLSAFLTGQMQTQLSLPDMTIRWRELDQLTADPPSHSLILDTDREIFQNITSVELSPATLLDNCQSYLFAGVNFRNTLINITSEQMLKILSGEITDWSQLQGTQGKIQLLLPSEKIERIFFPYGQLLANLLQGGSIASDVQYYDTVDFALSTLADEQNMIALLPAAAFDMQHQVRHLTIDDIAPLKRQGDRALYPLNYSLSLAYPTQADNRVLKDEIIPDLIASLEPLGYTNQACFPDLITLNAVGDMMLSRHVGTKIRAAGDNSLPFRQTAEFLSQADITFGNLESPFYDQGPPVTEGMVFKAEPETIEGLLLAGMDMVDLANNHFGNQGQAGMLYTYDHLTQNDIQYYGAGENYDAAHEVKIIETGGYKIGFLGYDEIPPASYAASQDKAGFAWEEETAVADDITLAREQTDFLIVSFHWGAEYTPHPSLNQQNFAHLAIDSGADMIISHHPHVVQAVEFYEGKFIAYSLGNFVFDQMWSLETQQGLIANIVLKPVKNPETDDRLLQPISIDLIPVRIYDYNQPDYADQAETDQILERVFAASDNLR